MVCGRRFGVKLGVGEISPATQEGIVRSLLQLLRIAAVVGERQLCAARNRHIRTTRESFPIAPRESIAPSFDGQGRENAARHSNRLRGCDKSKPMSMVTPGHPARVRAALTPRGSSPGRRQFQSENVAAYQNNFPARHSCCTSPSTNEQALPRCRGTVSER